MKFNPWPPALIFYSNKLDHGTYDKVYGTAKAFCIWISDEAKDDPCVLAHELEHVKQFYMTFGLHIFLLLIPKYKAWCEERAYRKQNSCYRKEYGI